MNGDLARALANGDGVLCRSSAPLPSHVIDYALRAGHLVRLYQGVYVDASRAEPILRYRAALAYLGDRAVLSHTTALEVWGLLDPTDGPPVHATVPPDVYRRSGRGLVVHRRAAEAGQMRRTLRVTRLETSIVDAWPLLPPAERRAPAIGAVSARRTTVDRLRTALRAAPHLTDRLSLRRLLDLLDAGCQSPLEIWGHEHVFTGPDMPPFQRQRRVRVGGRSVYLDVYAERERVNFELDGSATHTSSADRERDLRRDAALAALGIVVVRFTSRRLLTEPEGVRREVLAILAGRRAAA